MREIKFRAWDKEKNKMHEVLAVYLSEGEDGVIVYGKSYQDHETGEHDADKDFLAIEKVELMQYTGLKSKSGVEMYEGDIVKTYINDGTPLKVVKWDEQDCCFNIRGGLIREVIGNIYEHPELLK